MPSLCVHARARVLALLGVVFHSLGCGAGAPGEKVGMAEEVKLKCVRSELLE